MVLLFDFLKSNISERPVFIWGAWKIGKKVLEHLEMAEIPCAGFIDSQKMGEKFCGCDVLDIDTVLEHYENPYLILSIVEHQSVLEKLGNLKEFEDYLYLGKSVHLCRCNNYFDVYGSRIEGKIEDTQVEMSGGSLLKIEPGVKFGKNVKIICQLFSTITIKKGVTIQDNVTLSAKEQAVIVFENKVTIEEGSYIEAKDDSIVSVGEDISGSEAKEDYIRNPMETIIRKDSTMIARERAKIRIGKRCGFGHELQVIVAHDTFFICSNDCVLSYQVNVRGNNGHKIFDLEGKKAHIQKESVTLEPHVWIGMGVSILPGTHVGRNCIVGANSLTNKEYAVNSILAGQPAKEIKNNVNWNYKPFTTWEEFECGIAQNRK